jgi:hypothetical protein
MSDTVREWSRDWAKFDLQHFDWKSVLESFLEAPGEEQSGKDLSITQDEIKEYCEWLSIHQPETFRQLKEQMQKNKMEDLGF